MRVIGAPPPGATPRPGAYAVVIDDDWRVAVVLVGGEAFLPGGGIDPGETPEQAVHREVREETGLAIEVVASLGDAHEHHAFAHRAAVHRLAHYFSARVIGTGTASEADHTLVWWTGTEARERLLLGTERAIVRRALAAC
jgi:8-oxo-dGTP diphosphatase